MEIREENVREYNYSGSPIPFITFFISIIIVLFWDNLPLVLFPLGWQIQMVLIIVLLILLSMTIAINKQWEEAIVLRFGKYKRLVGPGIFFKWPIIEKFLKVDKRIQTLDVSRQEVMTKDNISLVADAVVFMKIINTADALMNIQNIEYSVVSYAQTTMRDIIGNVELDELLAQRDEIADKIKEIVDKETTDWGIDIISVNLQNIEIPEGMKRVIARQAEAERERRAVIIKSEGELRAAANLEAAVRKMSSQALYLRTLSSLEDISFDQSNTIVFAIPMDITRGEIIGITGLAGSQMLRPSRQSSSTGEGTRILSKDDETKSNQAEES